MASCDMSPNQLLSDGIYIKVGSLMEISAVGTFGITAFLLLVGIYVIARIIEAWRRRRQPSQSITVRKEPMTDKKKRCTEYLYGTTKGEVTELSVTVGTMLLR